MKRFIACASVLMSSAAFGGIVLDNVDATVESMFSLDSPPNISSRRVIGTNAVYSNATNTTGFGVTNGGAPAAGINTDRATNMIVDDITPLAVSVGQPVVRFSFSVVNFNATAQNMSPSVRFYTDNGGAPGTFLGGFNFNPIAIGAGQGGFLSFTIPVANRFNMPTLLWAGQFYRNGTQAVLNNLGALEVNPVDIGFSDFNVSWASTGNNTTGGNSHLVNNPAGAPMPLFTQGNNFGWEFVPAPGSAALLAAAGLISLRRRRA